MGWLHESVKIMNQLTLLKLPNVFSSVLPPILALGLFMFFVNSMLQMYVLLEKGSLYRLHGSNAASDKQYQTTPAGGLYCHYSNFFN